MKASLNVIKADGGAEKYLHTKVIHTINNGLEAVGRCDISVAESMAEVVTYFLYNKRVGLAVPSSEILSVIKVVLSATGYEDAAEALTEQDYQRRIRRSRTEVFFANIEQIVDSQGLLAFRGNGQTVRWDKSVIADDLITKYGLDAQSGRAVASMVEQKVFSLCLSRVPAGLVKQLVLNEAAAVLEAQHQLQPA